MAIPLISMFAPQVFTRILRLRPHSISAVLIPHVPVLFWRTQVFKEQIIYLHTLYAFIAFNAISNAINLCGLYTKEHYENAL
jgi:hypothetical protein